MDIVITYVDINDEFIKKYNKYNSKLQENRFTSYNVLDLQVKLIRKYAPFIKNIFIVVSDKSQVPKDLDLSLCKIVYHKDIIPEKFLPCFNSCTIEMFLHNIPELDEEFVYFNDDVFIIDYVSKKDFFLNHKPSLTVSIKDINPDEKNIYKKNLYNSTDLIAKYLKIENKYKNKYISISHSYFPMLKSVCKKVFDKNIYSIYGSLTRIRNSKNYNTSIFHNYNYLTKNYHELEKNYSYYSSMDSINNICNAISKKEHKFICVNNENIYVDFNTFKSKLRKALEANLEGKEYILPIKKQEKIIKETLSNNISFKIALCAIAKNENNYIKEWVDWYRHLGITKIFIYDNNDLDGERFEDVIGNYIDEGFVEIIDRRGIVKTVSTDKDGQTNQGLAYSDCWYSHYKEYDWMFFFDIDEYLEIYDKYSNLNEFLNDFIDYDGIRVQWKMYGDNDNLYYENKSLFKRFKTESNASYDRHVKQILNCNKEFDEELLFCAHGVFNKKFNFVNVIKEPVKNVYMDSSVHTDLPIYLNHFYCKSTEEFFKRKFNKPSAVTGINNKRNFNLDFLKNQYFEHNKFTEEKENYINIFCNSNNSVNVYMASLFKDGYVVDSIKSIIRQPQVKTLTLSANNYTDEQYAYLLSEIKSDKLIIHRTNNEKLSFEKLRFVTKDTSTKYVAFCDDDLIYYDGYFAKMINECERLDAVVSYHGGILKKPLPIEHYYPDRKSFSFNKEVRENKEVDIIGNGVSLFKRDWISKKQWKDLYINAPEVSMDDITVSYILRKNGKKLIVIKHSIGDVTERINNKSFKTVYNMYKNDDYIQTNYINKYFIYL